MTAYGLRRGLLLAVCLYALTIVALVLLRPLLPVDETRYLTVAWEMWQGGSRIVPHLNGELYSHKPPLLFWMMNGLWLVGGVSELAARLIAPTFGLAAVILTAGMARALWPDNPQRSGRAALILATGGVYLLFGSTTRFDAMLAAAVVTAMWALISLRKAPGVMPILGLGAALALGVMSKGPVVLVHVLPVALLMPLWADRANRPDLGRWYLGLGLGVLVGLGLVLLWLGPALWLGGAEYRADVLWRQSAGRMVGSFAHQQPFWFFVALLPVFFWPWGWSRPAMASVAPQQLWADEASRFLTTWAMTALIGFSLISGKQLQYLLPELPAVALLLSGMAAGPVSRVRRVVLVLPVLAAAGFAGAVYLGLVPFTRVNGAQLPILTLAAALVLSGLVGAAVWRVRSAMLLTALVAPALLITLHLGLNPMVWAGNNPDQIADILAEGQSGGIATTDTGYAGQFSFSGRLDHPVSILRDADALTAWTAAHPGGTVFARKDLADPQLDLILRRDFHGWPYRIYRVEGVQP